MELVRSKQRMIDHGEVFTPPEIVAAMIGLVQTESVRIDSRFLEPACGSGNFLVPVLLRKLMTVEARYGPSEFEKRHQALLALMSIYGLELLADNVADCRANLLEAFSAFLGVGPSDVWHVAAERVIEINIIHGDAIAMRFVGVTSGPIVFAEWSYLGKGKYHRRDFRLDTLTQMSSFGDGTLFADVGGHEIFTPTRDHGMLTVAAIAGGGAQ